MHLKKNGIVRNHGTAFRIEEKYLPDLFSSKINLLDSESEFVRRLVNKDMKNQKKLSDFEIS